MERMAIDAHGDETGIVQLLQDVLEAMDFWDRFNPSTCDHRE